MTCVNDVANVQLHQELLAESNPMVDDVVRNDDENNNNQKNTPNPENIADLNSDKPSSEINIDGCTSRLSADDGNEDGCQASETAPLQSVHPQCEGVARSDEDLQSVSKNVDASNITTTPTPRVLETAAVDQHNDVADDESASSDSSICIENISSTWRDSLSVRGDPVDDSAPAVEDTSPSRDWLQVDDNMFAGFSLARKSKLSFLSHPFFCLDVEEGQNTAGGTPDKLARRQSSSSAWRMSVFEAHRMSLFGGVQGGSPRGKSAMMYGRQSTLANIQENEQDERDHHRNDVGGGGNDGEEEEEEYMTAGEEDGSHNVDVDNQTCESLVEGNNETAADEVILDYAEIYGNTGEQIPLPPGSHVNEGDSTFEVYPPPITPTGTLEYSIIHFI